MPGFLASQAFQWRGLILRTTIHKEGGLSVPSVLGVMDCGP